MIKCRDAIASKKFQNQSVKALRFRPCPRLLIRDLLLRSELKAAESGGGNLAAIVGNVANVTRRAKQKLRTIFRIKI